MQAFKASEHGVAGVRFTPDGRGLVVSSYPQLTMWDVTGAPSPLRQFTAPVYGGVAVVSPCSRFLVHAGSALSVFDLTKPEQTPAVPLDAGWSHIAFSPDGSEMAKAAFTPRRWAVPSWEVIRSDPPPNNPPGGPFSTGGIAYTPDGRGIAESFAVMNPEGTRYDQCFRLFDLATGAHTDLHTTFGHAHPMHIAFSPDGKVIAGNFGPVLGVVSVPDGKQVARVKIGTKHITALAFTPDGSKLVTVSSDTKVRVFDVHTRRRPVVRLHRGDDDLAQATKFVAAVTV